MTILSILKERQNKWRRTWPVKHDDSELPMWILIQKLFEILNAVSATHIRGLWVTAKLVEKEGTYEEDAVLAEQAEIQEEFFDKNL